MAAVAKAVHQQVKRIDVGGKDLQPVVRVVIRDFPAVKATAQHHGQAVVVRTAVTDAVHVEFGVC